MHFFRTILKKRANLVRTCGKENKSCWNFIEGDTAFCCNYNVKRVNLGRNSLQKGVILLKLYRRKECIFWIYSEKESKSCQNMW